jgi:hypothetical protein
VKASEYLREKFVKNDDESLDDFSYMLSIEEVIDLMDDFSKENESSKSMEKLVISGFEYDEKMLDDIIEYMSCWRNRVFEDKRKGLTQTLTHTLALLNHYKNTIKNG